MHPEGISNAPAISKTKNPNEIVGLGVIGVGGQGTRLLRWAKEVPGVEIRAVNDIWDQRLEAAIQESGNPKVAAYSRYTDLLADKSLDAVIIATPDHLHVPVSLDAADAGLHIYCEKAMSTSLEQAKTLRDKIKGSNIRFQLGHNGRGSAMLFRSREIYTSGTLGTVTYVRTSYFRNSNVGEWRSQPPPACTPEHVDWQQFLGPAPSRPFDPRRYLDWRCYWDYGTGIAGDLLSHSLDSVNFVMSTGCPQSCVTTGGIYFWKDGRETPDHWNAVFDWPDRKLCVTFSCLFNNAHWGGNYFGSSLQFFGKEATLEMNARHLSLYPEEPSPRYEDFFTELREKWGMQPDETFRTREIPPVYQWEQDDNRYKSSSHIRNFVDAIRYGTALNCDIDDAFEEAVTVMMSVEAFQRERKVFWDPVKQEIA